MRGQFRPHGLDLKKFPHSNDDNFLSLLLVSQKKKNVKDRGQIDDVSYKIHKLQAYHSLTRGYIKVFPMKNYKKSSKISGDANFDPEDMI